MTHFAHSHDPVSQKVLDGTERASGYQIHTFTVSGMFAN